MTGRSPKDFGPYVLNRNEAKRVDLVLDAPTAPGSHPPVASPEFFDEPQFTVAGVTQATNAGGHGSDAIRRNTESLAKETASLGKESAGTAETRSAAAEASLREAAAREPRDFEANSRLGKFLVEHGNAEEAIPYLEQAARLNPSDYANSYQLAVAYAETGELKPARTNARALLAHHDTAELHYLLAGVEEKLGNPLDAVREYQRAAEQDPSERHLFDWGSELLTHRAAEPAIEVFTKGNHLFPPSSRMLIGLGVAWYTRGAYDQAAKCIFDASDQNPEDPTPYLFLGRIQSVGKSQPDGFVERFGRFVRLQPESALANYYYAVSLRKQSALPLDTQTSAQVESLLQKAVRLDPKLGAGYLQLGILYSDRHDFPRAITAYQEAIEANPGLEEPHYRLAQAYRRVGEQAKAQEQLKLFDQLSRQTTEQVEHERQEIQQFVFALRDGTPSTQPQQKP